MESFFHTDSFTLLQGDSMEQLKHIDQKVDVVFADPPYFLSQGVSKCINGTWKSFDKGEWDRVTSLDNINAFNRKWLSACRELLKDNGTIWACGTYHNIFSVATCMAELGFKILNIIVWQKSDAKPTLSRNFFNFTTEYIIWARKEENKPHYFNCELMEQLNGGARMTDVWRFPFVASWEMTCGKHPTQKPLRLLNRIILSCTHEGDTILDPFAGSCTTGVAANLLGRKFIGIDMDEKYLELGRKRYEEIQDPVVAAKYLRKMQENPEETMVLVNHAKPESLQLMIEKGICYLRAGESDGSLEVTPGFERMQYVCLHSNGDNVHIFRLKKKGCFNIWTKETLEAHGFHPSHAPYYIVLPFDNKKEIEHKNLPQLKQRLNTYRAKIRPLSDFIGIK